MRPSPNKLISLAFFTSGFASLIYEIIWIRMLVLIFGNTSYSTTIVLSVFMAGLAFGSFIFGRISDRTNKLLQLYVVVEITIGLLALTSPLLINLVKQTFLHLEATLLLKLILSFIVLFPVTTLIGATLPVLISFVRRFENNLSPIVGRLYAINTFGAVCGTLLAGLVLIELFGLIGAIVIGSLGNFVAAGAGLYILSGDLSFSDKKLPNFDVQSFVSNSYQKTLLIFSYIFSGLITLSYEIIFIRLITPSMGTYIYGFSFSLAIFLLGLSLGSKYYQVKLSRVKKIVNLNGWIQLMLGLTSLLSLIFIAHIIPLWLPHPLIRLIAPVIVFLPLSFFSGIIFPSITATFQNSKHVGFPVGMIYSLNSIGSIIGSILATFVLIPFLGSVPSAILLLIINLIFALLMFLSEKKSLRFAPAGILLSVILLFISVIALYYSDKFLVPRYISVNLYHQKRAWGSVRSIFKEDAIASVFASSAPPRASKRLLIDGIGTTSLSEETKIMAHLPILLHPHPKKILVIAFGMGTTYRSSLAYPEVHVDGVELVPSVPKVMEYFHANANKVLSNPRGKIIINDGRNYVFTTTEKYDVVTIDPPPPDNAAGTTVLFSSEMYQDIKRILNPDGIVAAWFHYDLDLDSYKMILHSYLENFPYVLIFKSPRNLGLYLLGSQQPLVFNKAIINQKLIYHSVLDDMKEYQGNIYDYSYLKTLFLGFGDKLYQFSRQMPPITDYRPRSEYFLIRQLLRPQPLIDQTIIDNIFSG